MDWNAILTGVGVVSGIGTAIVGWFMSAQRAEQTAMKAEHADLARAFNNHQIEVARMYVPHARFDATVSEISRKLDTIIASLADKADRE